MLTGGVQKSLQVALADKLKSEGAVFSPSNLLMNKHAEKHTKDCRAGLKNYHDKYSEPDQKIITSRYKHNCMCMDAVHGCFTNSGISVSHYIKTDKQ